MPPERNDEKEAFADKTADCESQTAPVSFSESSSDRETTDATRTSGVAARASAAAFAPGQIVAGRYEIVRFIAQGGMGVVYEARDRKLQGTLALKMIRTDVAGRRRPSTVFSARCTSPAA